MRDRERLIARIRQMARAVSPADGIRHKPAVDPTPDQFRVLEVRVEHLEALVQGLQDSVHREFLRQAKRISELEARLEPATLGKALSEDARARGL